MTTSPRTLLQRAVDALSAMRRSLRNFLFTLLGVALLLFLLSPGLLGMVQRHLGGTLYFFSVAGPFLAHVKIALFAAFFLLAPWFIALLWRLLARVFAVDNRQLRVFSVFTCLLFYGGACFCWFVTLPYGIEFLLGFGTEQLKPVISVGRCINFAGIFLLGFAVVFELPIFMLFFAKVKLVSLAFYRRNRRYAVLVIAILAAVLTPTPDVVNMALMGAPLYLLYEAGIAVSALVLGREGDADAPPV